jgi:penicillin amidase
MNRAQNWDEFRNALRDFDVPAQNVVYADVDGNIAYQMPGRIPMRAAGDGLLPVPGWTDQYEWTGFIPFDELPTLLNPPQGYIATANNAVVGPDYPYLISLDWDRGYRAQRIADLLDVDEPITPEYVAQMQADNLNLSAQEILPYLLKLSFNPQAEPELAGLARRLATWDYRNNADSGPAAIYEAFWAGLLAETFHDELPQEMWPTGNDVSRLRVRNLLSQPDNAWWDNVNTPEVETRDAILRRALARAQALLVERLGANPDRWTWGRLHTARFVNATLGQSGIAPVEALFNRGPIPVGGGTAIVNATAYELTEGFEVTSLPSMRLIVDLADLDNSRLIHTTGQSGHPFNPHYADMLRRWAQNEYHPMLWSREAIEAQVEGRLLFQR